MIAPLNDKLFFLFVWNCWYQWFQLLISEIRIVDIRNVCTFFISRIRILNINKWHVHHLCIICHYMTCALFVCLFVYLFVYLFIYLFVCLFIYLFIYLFIIPSSPDSVGEKHYVLGLSRCSVRPFVRSFVRQILLPRYIMNGLNNCDKIDKEYSLVPAHDLIRLWRSKVKGQGLTLVEVCGGKGIHVDGGRWSSSLVSLRNLQLYKIYKCTSVARRMTIWQPQDINVKHWQIP